MSQNEAVYCNIFKRYGNLATCLTEIFRNKIGIVIAFFKV